jgi:hypothetical protein
MGFRRDVRSAASGFDQAPQAIGIVAFVGMHEGPAGASASNRSPVWQSAACPPVSTKRRGRPVASVRAWIFVVRPPRERPMA